MKNIFVGSPGSWAADTRAALEQLGFRYVLLMLDDFLLRRGVVSGKIEACLQALVELDGSYLRLRPSPPPNRTVHGYAFIGQIAAGAPYRVSLQASIWRKDLLASLLRDGESPWEMELMGSLRASGMNGFYSVWSPAIRYRHCVERGRWLRYGVRICRMEDVEIDFRRRGVMTRREAVWRWMRHHVLLGPLRLLPLRQRLGLTGIIRSGLKHLRDVGVNVIFK